MDFIQYLRRAGLAFMLVAIGSGGAVYLLHDWFHTRFLASLGVSAAAGDTIGGLLILLAAYIGVRIASISIYRDWLFGLAKAMNESVGRGGTMGAAAAEVGHELEQVAKFNDVVRGQLNTVVTETEAAAYNVVSRLQTIDEVITSLSSYIDSSSAESNQMLATAERRIEHNKELLASLDRYIDQRIGEAQEDQQRIAQVVHDARSLSALVDLIRNISKQTNLLALNAAIEAARAGESGRGFAVVADQVRKLSGESEQAVQQINQGIDRVAESIEQQFADKLAHSNIEAERKALQTFAQQLSELGNSYSEVTRHEQKVINSVHESSGRLTSMFMDALASIQFQDVTRQQVEQVNNALSRLDSHAQLLAQRLERFDDPDFKLTPLTEHLDQIYGSYVMSSQRNSHDSALKTQHKGSESAGPKVELF